MLQLVGQMGLQMILQMGLALEFLVALIASKGPCIIRMFVDHVTLQVTFLAQCQIAYWALHWFAAVNYPFVVGQPSSRWEFLVTEFAFFGLQVWTLCFVYI